MKAPSFLHKWFVYDSWAVAWRVLPDTHAPYPASGGETPRYRVLDAGRGHWLADPFLLSHGGRVWLFFEYMPLHSKSASIGCCTLSRGGPGPIQPVLEGPCHLSYPAVFEYGGEIYMLPESLGSRSVTLYRAADFPHRWEAAAALLTNFDAVDTTPQLDSESVTLFIYDPDAPHNALRRLYTARLDPSKLILGPLTERAAYPAPLGRPAGLPFRQNGERVRPTQDGTRRYGGSVRYLAYGEQDGRWIEREAGTLCPGDVASDLPFRARGLHTINRGGGFEVIDLYYERFSLLKPVRALLRRLCRR